MSQNFDKNLIAKKFSLAAKYYDSYAQIQSDTAQKLVALIKDNFQKDITILDLACGSGLVYREIKNALPKLTATFIAADISFEMLQINAKNFNENYLVQCDFDNLPFAPAAFDLIISSSSLQWSSNLNMVIENSYQLLKSNGIFAFSLPINGSLSELKDLSQLANCNFGFNDLPDIEDIKKYLYNSSFKDFEFTIEVICEDFKDPLSAINSIKRIGASYNASGNFIKKSDLARFKQLYTNSNLKNFTNSWNILFIIAKK